LKTRTGIHGAGAFRAFRPLPASTEQNEVPTIPLLPALVQTKYCIREVPNSVPFPSLAWPSDAPIVFG
jgi:hypothetical protein